LTKAEALQAADSALYGQASARQVRVLTTMVVVYEEEVTKRDTLIATMKRQALRKDALIATLDEKIQKYEKRIAKLEKKPGKVWRITERVLYAIGGFFVGRATSPIQL
jgi:lambda repressor-like predicted transcriptional regulator